MWRKTDMVFDMVKLREWGGREQPNMIRLVHLAHTHTHTHSSASAYTAANVPIYQKRNDKTEEAKSHS